MEQKKHPKIVPLLCLIIYISVLVRSGIRPFDTEVRVVEALTSVLPVLMLIILYVQWIRFSSMWYILMSILPIMHAIGAHYTFSNVPSQWLSDLLGTERNMYDRVAHASVWLYAFGIIEIIDSQKLTSSWWLKLSYALFAIMSLAALYELFEWQYAVSSDPSAWIAVLGSQWDIRDAQKDILMDSIGGVIWIVLYICFGSRRSL